MWVGGGGFVKTHKLPDVEHRNCTAIYLVRNGVDAILSHAAFMKYQCIGEAVEDRAILDCLVSPAADAWNWSQHVTEWMSRVEPTQVVRFEDLIADPVATVAAALRSLGREADATPHVMSFASLHRTDPRIYGTGVARVLPPDLRRAFDTNHGSVMDSFGYRCMAA